MVNKSQNILITGPCGSGKTHIACAMQLNRERERLAYAQIVARQHNIEPALFMDKAPLNIGLVTKSQNKK